MGYTAGNTYEYSPNNSDQFEIATSFDPSLFGSVADRDVAQGETGVGSQMMRSVATKLAKYRPYDFTFDTMSQIFGNFEPTGQRYHEWGEGDVLLEYAGDGVALDQTDVINNPDAGNTNTYVPNDQGRFVVSSADGKIFEIWDKVRYETATGYAHALVIDKADVNSDVALTLTSLDGSTNLDPADSATAKIHRLEPNLPVEFEVEPKPRKSNPDMYFTYVEEIRREIYMSRELSNLTNIGSTRYDLIAHYQEQLFNEFRRDREVQALAGGALPQKFETTNGDTVWSSAGVYERIAGVNKHTSDFKTSGAFDKDKFKDAIRKFMLYNYGGESDGPDIRDGYICPVMASYFDEAWEDIQRFEGNDFVAGVRVNRYSNSQGIMDLIQIPLWSELHPLKDASIRNGNSLKGVLMLLPMDEEHVYRHELSGMGPRQEIFKLNGGDRNEYQRVEGSQGLGIRKIQHAGVLAEIDEV